MKRAFALLPGALVVWLAFNGGGFFAGEPALAAAILCVLLVLRVTVMRDPGEGFSPALLVAGGALTLLACWTLASGIWSDSPARALLEFDRVLLYLLTLVLLGSFLRTGEQVRWAVRGVAAGIVVVCGIAFVTRALPEVWPTEPNILQGRLSYPLTYWNALGLLAGLGMVLCLGLTTDERESRVGRIAAAAALPVLGSALLLTLSRGGLWTAAGGLVAYALIARPRGFPAGFLAAAPATAIAMGQCYRADLVQAGLAEPGAVAQGHDLALTVALCALGAGLLRAILLGLDGRLARLKTPWLGRRFAVAAAGATLAAAVAASAAADVGGRVSDQYNRFVEGRTVDNRDDSRLTDVSSNGRLKAWRVSMDAFEREPVHGSGAGTFQLVWAKDRPGAFTQHDAHSLYAETLGELGVVGLALLLTALLGVLGGVAARVRGPDRALYAAVLAAGLTWALAAAVDWHWEMAAVTLPFFALGGAALASDRARLPTPGRPVRVAIAVGLLVLAVTPARVAVSQARLDDALHDFKRGDCAGAIDSALASTDAIGARAEPFEVLAWCDARLGKHALAERMIRAAIRRDPRNWELHYSLALVRGAARADPRPAARQALRLNPRGELVNEAARRFRTRNPRLWEKRARSARLPLR